jgi:hypothetical protein
MVQNITPFPSQEQEKSTASEQKMYGMVTHSARTFVALHMFFVVSLVTFLMATYAATPLPSYLPDAEQLVAPLALLQISLYSTLLFSVLVGALCAFIFYILVPFIHSVVEIRFKTFKNFTTFAILFAIPFTFLHAWIPWSKGIGNPVFILLAALGIFLFLLSFILIVERKIHE